MRRSKISMKLSLSSFTFLSVIVLFFSCTKIITSDIGSGLIPPVDGVNTKDTSLDIITKNTDYDSAGVGISDNHILGYTNDDIFGSTTASLNFQVAPPSAPFSWGIEQSNVVLDSVVLCLKYESTWGDTLQPLRLHVYTMDPENLFNNDSTYNNTKTFEKGIEITENNTAKIIYPYTLDDIDTTSNGEVATGQVRIRLNNSFAQQIVDYDSALVYQNDSTFYTALRGLIVEPEQSGNSLLMISLTDTSTHLSVYYHSSISTDTIKYSRRFSPNTLTSASSNSIIRNYQGTQIPSYVGTSNPNDDLIFMQTSPGIYAKIQTPGLSALSNRIIHRAELLMYQVPDVSNTQNDAWFTAPNLFLAALGYDSLNPIRFAIPYDIIFSNSAITNLTQFGVAPLTRIDPNTGLSQRYYSFDLTRYVQGIVTRKDSVYNLVLYAPYNQYIYPADQTSISVPISSPSLNNVGIGRVRLGGGSNAQYKMRLHIVYSDIN